MLTLDAQVHAYERDHPGRPWAAVLHGPPEVTGADMVAAMDEVGVDGALLVSPFTLYRYDASYAIEVQAAYPRRFESAGCECGSPRKLRAGAKNYRAREQAIVRIAG